MSHSVRTRMTLLYGGFFALITIGVPLAALGFQALVVGHGGAECGEADCPDPPMDEPHDGGRITTLVAIAVIVVLAFAVCWWLTGRMLRPLHRITDAARRLSLSTLHERIALTGPDDELRRLADTFDAMLDRLERAASSQRRFVANASHELRTPLAVQRTAIEVGLANPTPERLERIRAELLSNTLRSERIIHGLLQLANGERGPDAPAPVELATVVRQVVAEHPTDAVTVRTALTPVTVLGDEVMLAQMVSNLVRNAIRYNVPDGGVQVALLDKGELTISNSGPRVAEETAGELFEPFRSRSRDGAGLGLSIVAAIVRAHGGTVTLRPNPEGGLTVRVCLPPHPV
ncbi:HAMP domain-containing histidine kinase [Actinoplanes hulinensis]|uniref:histidine kinase n=1 Tax=Actinoplanes hulinensis TaxID=1144547 RepID=A0ABS7BFF7_9ACTN|nr:HAMP domain-containing sensor histidine kinase [Actinoplanes hulinensis]MBW6439578.1 HAMP domain-containing histidine kinase [Actinoplanes hulinensis]